jgi:glycosyltransferase involved in cell wall biosynthesis
MDFVTITDHDTITGVLEIADEPDVFISEELTAWFKDEPQAVHVLCFGITPEDHDWLQKHRGNVAACAGYMHGRSIACALAHPFVHVAAPLTPGHRRTLAELFPIWETRNGRRAPELNAPAAIYIETNGGIAVGGSDDHAGIDIGRTYTQAPHAATTGELLAHIRAGRVAPHGEHGTVAKSAHAALVLSARALTDSRPALHHPPAADTTTLHHPASAQTTALHPVPADTTTSSDPPAAQTTALHNPPARPDAPGGRHTKTTDDEAQPRSLPRNLDGLLTIVERMMLEHDGRANNLEGTTPATDGRWLLMRWLQSTELPLDPRWLVATIQTPDFSHADLERRARRVHERRLTMAARQAIAGGADDDPAAVLVPACLPALPYISAAARAARERAGLVAPGDEQARVAVIADGVGAVPGFGEMLASVRERSLSGVDIDLIGTAASVDRRLPTVTELELPLYPGQKVGVPSVLAVAQALSERPYDLVHVCAPTPAGIAALLVARAMRIPVASSCPAGDASAPDEPRWGWFTRNVLGPFYRRCAVLLSSSDAADAQLEQLGVGRQRIRRWARGVDLARFNPAQYDPEVLRSDAFNILYVGRLGERQEVDLLSEAFLLARDRDPTLQLVLASPLECRTSLPTRLASAATFLGPLESDALARVYATADLLVFPSATDTTDQPILEAQASGLPVLAVDGGGREELIENGRSGCLVPAVPETLSAAIRGLARRAALRDRLATGGLLAVRERGWERSLSQLASAWQMAINESSPSLGVSRAA